MKIKITIISLVLALMGIANLAFATEVTGVISTGLTGNVNELTGTVITPPIRSGGGGGGGGYVAVPVKIVATTTATTTRPLVLGVSTFRFTRLLRLGLSGNDVKELQERLRAEGIFKYPVSTGYFGNLTRTALISYQKKHKFPQTGTLYLKVRNKLNS
jgi:hypothetical protein